MQSQVNCSQAQRFHQLLFSLQKEGHVGWDEKRRGREGRRKVTDSRSLKKTGLYYRLPSPCSVSSASPLICKGAT